MTAIVRGLNILALFAIVGLIAVAFWHELVRGQAACPLCLVQRAALLAAGFGFMLNARYGSAEHHYGIVIVSALVGAAAALRQMLPQIVAGSAAPGPVLLSLHYSTWVLIVCAAAIFLSGVLLFLETQFMEGVHDTRPGAVAQAVAWLFVIAAFAGAVAVLLQCGFGSCEEGTPGAGFLRRH